MTAAEVAMDYCVDFDMINYYWSDDVGLIHGLWPIDGGWVDSNGLCVYGLWPMNSNCAVNNGLLCGLWHIDCS